MANRRTQARAALIAGLALAFSSVGAAAQGILKKEPGQGILWQGEIVFVDDGSCPPGQIKMVIGSGRPKNEIVLDSSPRDSKRCIVRPNS